jgi:hypothetical protein
VSERWLVLDFSGYGCGPNTFIERLPISAAYSGIPLVALA